MKKLATLFLALCLAAAAAVSASAEYEACDPKYANDNLTPFDVPTNGVVFTFDGTYATAGGELTATPKGTPEFIEDRNGKKDGAIYLDTAQDYLDLLQADYKGGNWTVSAWVRTDEAIEWCFLLHSETGSLRPVTNANVLGEIGVTEHNTFTDHMFNVGLELGEWQMLTFTQDFANKLITVYIDGEPAETFENTMGLPLAIIGGDCPELHNWARDMYMAIDDLWIVGRTLSDADVKTLYETGAFEQAAEGTGKISEEELAAIAAAEKAAARAALEEKSYASGLEKYEIPAEGIHFAFDGTYATDNGELKGEAQGSVVSVADRNGKADSAVLFDTADDFVLVNKADFWGDWSASAWIKFDGAFPNYSFLTQSGTHYSLRPAFNGGLGELGVGRHTGDKKIATTLTIDKWQMVTYAYNDAAATVTVYLDGVEVGVIEDCEMPLALAFIGSDAPADLGGNGWAIDPHMNVDDLWLFGKTLTAAEVTALYNNNTIVGTAAEEEVVETPVVEEPAVEEPKEEVVETPAEEVVEAPAAEEKAPQTSDALVFAVIFLVTALGMALTVRKVRA